MTTLELLALVQAGYTKAEIAALEDPPKQDPPKQDPPKQDPPKQDPPKQDPPKQDPPKQDPPKQDPPKQDPVLAAIQQLTAAIQASHINDDTHNGGPSTDQQADDVLFDFLHK